MGQEIASQEAATRVLDALRAVDYVGTAGDIILEIEGEFFRVKVTEARIAAIHRFQRRKVDAIKQLEAVLATPPASPAEQKTPEQIAEAIASDEYGDETNGYASWMSNHSCGPYYGCCGGGKEIDRAELARAIAAAIRSTSAVPHSAFIRDHEDGRPLVERITTDQARMDTTGDATDSRTAPTEGR